LFSLLSGNVHPLCLVFLWLLSVNLSPSLSLSLSQPLCIIP
jgi:hypothetical protein